MRVSVSTLMGLQPILGSKPACLAWLRRAGVKLHTSGNRYIVEMSDLPPDVRRAWELRQIEAAGLPSGEYDDAAHDRFTGASPLMQAVALRKAEVARFLVAGGASAERGLTTALCDQVRAKFGADGTDRMTLRRILRAVAGIDPVNFAPALLPPTPARASRQQRFRRMPGHIS